MGATPADVVACARSYLGVRYHHQGRSRAGLDCAGLVVLVARDLGLSTFDTADYARQPNGERLRDLMREHCAERAPGAAPRVGDVALIRFERDPQHLAIIGDRSDGALALVHALMLSRRVVEHRLDTAWRVRIVGLFALPGVDYGEG